MKLEFTVPIKATASLNARLHWAVRARKVRQERFAVMAAFPRVPHKILYADRLGIPLVITLTRVGPRKLDGDNVQGALKAIRDQIADQIDQDDGSEHITWRYEQEKGDYAVRVRIETAEAEAA